MELNEIINSSPNLAYNIGTFLGAATIGSSIGLIDYNKRKDYSISERNFLERVGAGFLFESAGNILSFIWNGKTYLHDDFSSTLGFAIGFKLGGLVYKLTSKNEEPIKSTR